MYIAVRMFWNRFEAVRYIRAAMLFYFINFNHLKE